MRYSLTLPTLLILGAWISHADRVTFDPTKTQIALPLDTAPIIDGVIETTEWERAAGAPGNSWSALPDVNLEDGIRGGQLGDVATPPVDNADLGFTIYAGYDAQNLYIAVRVTDSVLMNDDAAADSANLTTWMDDGVEVFVDGDNSNFESRDTSGTNPEVVGTGGQFVITANNAYRDQEAGNPGYGESAAWYARVVPNDDGTGYQAEFRISLASLGNPKPGDIIGFTVGVNDDDDGAGSERQLMWVGSPHTEVTYGNLVLGGRSYEAPKTAAPTVDGIINAAEYAGAAEIRIDPHTAIWDIPSGDDTFEGTDLGYSAWVIHDADSVYVAMDVTDDNRVNDSAEAGSEDGTTWEDDSVEIFFDANHDRELGQGTLGFEGQYVFTANGAWRDAEAHNPTFGANGDWFAATTVTDHGYQVEFRIKKSALSNPADGALMGFNLAQNDDDGLGRQAQAGWSGRAHSEFTYGTLKLGAAVVPGEIQIKEVKVVGSNLELVVATPNCSGSPTVQKSARLGGGAEWTDVSGVTLGACEAGVLTATFPAPATSEFYRVSVQ